MIVYPVARLNIPKANKNVGDYVTSIYDHVLNNPHFPDPIPTMAVLLVAITEFKEAQAKVGTNTRGAAATRNAKKRKLRALLEHLRDYVQSVMEQQTSPEAGVAVAEGAFMSVKKGFQRTFPDVRVRHGMSPGSVVAEAKAVARAATYYWEYSLDQQTWTSVPEVLRAKLTISGLRSACTYYFRFRALTRKGEHGYSQVVSIIVH